jgi:hypothetical protein
MQMRHVIDAELLVRIRGEFLEMPGLRVTIADAARLWQLEPGACRALLTALVEQHSLSVTKDGAYVQCSQ